MGEKKITRNKVLFLFFLYCNGAKIHCMAFIYLKKRT